MRAVGPDDARHSDEARKNTTIMQMKMFDSLGFNWRWLQWRYQPIDRHVTS